MASRVLITGARAAAALDLARDFRAAGCEPWLADCSPVWIARGSSAPAGVLRYPSPTLDGAAFRKRIVEIIDELGISLVIPVCEEVFHLAAPALEDTLGARLFAPPLPTLRRLHDKLAFAQACADWGLPAPESYPVDDTSGLARFAGDSAEWVFKPRFSRFGEAALVGPSRAQLEGLALPPGRPWLAQRRLAGQEASFYAVARQGTLSAFAAYRSDWRLRGGAAFAFEPLVPEAAADLREIAATLARATSITGQFACDVIFDDGRAWLIECNPRATSGVHLLAGPGQLARAILGEPAAPAQHGARAHLLPAMLLFGLPDAVRSGRLSAWRRAMADGQDALSRPGDRLSLLGALADAAHFALAGWRHGVSTSEATTRDIEWNGEALR